MSKAQVASTGVAAVLVLALASISSRSEGVRAEDDPQSGLKILAPDSAGPTALTAEIRRLLKKQHDRMINLANELLDQSDVPENLEGQIACQQTKIEAAKANSLSAQLNREIAEMAVAEYEQGIFVQEKAGLDEEIKIAKSELEGARQHVPEARDRLLRIQLTSKHSTSDIANEFWFSGQEAGAQLKEQMAGIALKRAKSELKTLVEHSRAMRGSQLQSAVARSRADELMKRALLLREQSKLERLRKASKARDLASPQRNARNLHDRQALASLDLAFPIEEQLLSALDQLSKDGKLDEPLRKKIQGLTDQLQALVDQAEIEHSAAQFEKLKKSIQ